MQLSNASALLPQHCLAVAAQLKDTRDGLDEAGSLKLLQLLSALCLLPAFVSQSQCSAAGHTRRRLARRVSHPPCVRLTQLPQHSRSCSPSTRIKILSSAKLPLPSP